MRFRVVDQESFDQADFVGQIIQESPFDQVFSLFFTAKAPLIWEDGSRNSGIKIIPADSNWRKGLLPS